MTATHSPASPVVDQDWRRACRLAHTFGAAAAGAFVLLLVLASQFRTQPVPHPVLLAAGSVFAAAGGLAADLMVRPAWVRLDGGWLAVSRLGHGRRVHIDQLAGLSRTLMWRAASFWSMRRATWPRSTFAAWSGIR